MLQLIVSGVNEYYFKAEGEYMPFQVVLALNA
jgi:hypothetical protein